MAAPVLTPTVFNNPLSNNAVTFRGIAPVHLGAGETKTVTVKEQVDEIRNLESQVRALECKAKKLVERQYDGKAILKAGRFYGQASRFKEVIRAKQEDIANRMTPAEMALHLYEGGDLEGVPLSDELIEKIIDCIPLPNLTLYFDGHFNSTDFNSFKHFATQFLEVLSDIYGVALSFEEFCFIVFNFSDGSSSLTLKSKQSIVFRNTDTKEEISLEHLLADEFNKRIALKNYPKEFSKSQKEKLYTSGVLPEHVLAFADSYILTQDKEFTFADDLPRYEVNLYIGWLKDTDKFVDTMIGVWKEIHVLVDDEKISLDQAKEILSFTSHIFYIDTNNTAILPRIAAKFDNKEFIDKVKAFNLLCKEHPYWMWSEDEYCDQFEEIFGISTTDLAFEGIDIVEDE